MTTKNKSKQKSIDISGPVTYIPSVHRLALRIFSAACFLALGATGHADILFSTGPDQLAFGPGNLPANFGGYADSDAFTLGAGSVLTTILYSDWIDVPYVPSTVFWAITTDRVSGGSAVTGLSSVVASGTANLTNTLVATCVARDCNTVYESSFPVDVPLAAGSYFLWLGDETPAAGGSGWGYASNTGGASQQFLDGNLAFDGGGELSFELDGTTVPEPSNWVLLLSIGTSVLITARHKLR